MTKAALDEAVTVADIADWRGWSRTTAWRWLCEKEKQHGAKVVERRGRRLFTTREALARVSIEMPDPSSAKVVKRIEILEKRIAEAEKRADGLAGELIEFRRKSYDWFKKHVGTAPIRK